MQQQKHQESRASQTVSSTASQNPCPLPDVISGDFDSIQTDLLKIYAAKGVTIVPTPDQDETDFTKALRVLDTLLKKHQTSVSGAPSVIYLLFYFISFIWFIYFLHDSYITDSFNLNIECLFVYLITTLMPSSKNLKSLKFENQ